MMGLLSDTTISLLASLKVSVSTCLSRNTAFDRFESQQIGPDEKHSRPAVPGTPQPPHVLALQPISKIPPVCPHPHAPTISAAFQDCCRPPIPLPACTSPPPTSCADAVSSCNHQACILLHTQPGPHAADRLSLWQPAYPVHGGSAFELCGRRLAFACTGEARAKCISREGSLDHRSVARVGRRACIVPGKGRGKACAVITHRSQSRGMRVMRTFTTPHVGSLLAGLSLVLLSGW